MNRPKKIIRNTILCLILVGLTYLSLGCPVYTVSGMCRQAELSLLMPDLEPLHVSRAEQKYSGELLSRKRTYIIARSGEHYVDFQYERDGLRNDPFLGGYFDVVQGGLCSAWQGELYAAGPFQEADSATATVRLTSKEGETRDFTYQGEKIGEEIFLFDYAKREDSFYYFFIGDTPVAEMDLPQLTMYWYRTPSANGSGHSYDHADLPVTISLQNGAGETIETLEYTLDTYEIHSWH